MTHLMIIQEEVVENKLANWEGRLQYLRYYIQGENKKNKEKLDAMDE